MFGVGPDAVRRWEKLGYVPGDAVIRSGRIVLYELNALADAEVMAREAAERTSGTTTRATRRFGTAA